MVTPPLVAPRAAVAVNRRDELSSSSPPPPSGKPQPHKASTGFTLTELLVVVAIIVALMALLTPAFTGLLKTKGLARAMNDVSEMIDFARTEAMAKGTYVWLGFYNATVDGSSQLQVVALRSLDATPTLTSANTRIISKVQKLDNVLLTDNSGLTSNVRTMLSNAMVTTSNAPAVSDSSSATQGIAVSVSGSSTTFRQFITFTPQGEGLFTPNPSTATPPTPFTTQMLIGLRKTAGTTPLPSDADSVGLVLYGGTGQVRVFRP